MQVELNPKNASRALGKFIEEKGGIKVPHADILELMAGMAGFSSWRAMKAAQDAQAAQAEENQSLSGEMPLLDWEFKENPNAALSEQQRRKFTLRAEQGNNALRLLVKPTDVAADGALEGQPVLSVYVEINTGVPAVSISNEVHEDLLTVYSTPDGLFVRHEDGEWVGDEAPQEDTELARVVQELGPFVNGELVLNDTARKYD